VRDSSCSRDKARDVQDKGLPDAAREEAIQVISEDKDQNEPEFRSSRAELMPDIVVKCDETRCLFLCMSTTTE
jgi:hypothetical protein